jgi:hypothetical protein
MRDHQPTVAIAPKNGQPRRTLCRRSAVYRLVDHEPVPDYQEVARRSGDHTLKPPFKRLVDRGQFAREVALSVIADAVCAQDLKFRCQNCLEGADLSRGYCLDEYCDRLMRGRHSRAFLGRRVKGDEPAYHRHGQHDAISHGNLLSEPTFAIEIAHICRLLKARATASESNVSQVFPTLIWVADLAPDLFTPLNEAIRAKLDAITGPRLQSYPGEPFQRWWVTGT